MACTFCDKDDCVLEDFRGRPFGNKLLAALPSEVRETIDENEVSVYIFLCYISLKFVLFLLAALLLYGLPDKNLQQHR